jgi:hypothetical protein
MKFESRIFLFSAAFLAVVALVYWRFSYEEVGTTMLGLGGAAWVLLWVYLAVQARRLRGQPRPEDRDDATIEGSAGPVGWFPSASVWPLALGAGATVLGLGFVFGPWFALIGVILMVAAAAGYAAEAQRR